MKNDIYFDPITKDLAFTSTKDIRFTVDEIEFVSQKIENEIYFFEGEWFLDYSAGIPYFTKIFLKNPDINLVNFIFLNTIKSIAEIKKILKFNTIFENNTGKYVITLEATLSDNSNLNFSLGI